jgi:DNA-binding PucR family transcriptional regulator
LHDQYQKQIDLIVDYERRKRTNLLETLEIYLECGGNVAKTSGQLDVHRNTLLQRIERLQKLCELDLEQCQHRLPLLIALKVYRLRTGS